MKGMPRYHPSPPGRAPSSTISRRKRATSSGVIPKPPPSSRSMAPPSSRASRSGSRGMLKAAMYHDFRPWREVNQERMKASGWGTESAVSVATFCGSRVAATQAVAAPQSWPTRCARPPTASTTASASRANSCTA